MWPRVLQVINYPNEYLTTIFLGSGMNMSRFWIVLYWCLIHIFYIIYFVSMLKRKFDRIHYAINCFQYMRFFGPFSCMGQQILHMTYHKIAWIKCKHILLFRSSLLLTWLHFFPKYTLEVDINTSHNMTYIWRCTWHRGQAMSTWPTYLTHVHWHLTNKIHKPLGFWGHWPHYNCICKYCVNLGIWFFMNFCL